MTAIHKRRADIPRNCVLESQIDLFTTVVERALNNRINDFVAVSELSLDPVVVEKISIRVNSEAKKRRLHSTAPIHYDQIPGFVKCVVRTASTDLESRLDSLISINKSSLPCHNKICCDDIIEDFFHRIGGFVPVISDWKMQANQTKLAIDAYVKNDILHPMEMSDVSMFPKHHALIEFRNSVDKKTGSYLLDFCKHYYHSLPIGLFDGSIYFQASEESLRLTLKALLLKHGASRFCTTLNDYSDKITIVVKKGDEKTVLDIANLSSICLSKSIRFFSLNVTKTGIDDSHYFKCAGTTVIVDTSFIERDYETLSQLFEYLRRNSTVTLKLHYSSYEHLSNRELHRAADVTSNLTHLQRCEMNSTAAVLSKHDCDRKHSLLSQCLHDLACASHLIARNVIFLTHDIHECQRNLPSNLLLTVDFKMMLQLDLSE